MRRNLNKLANNTYDLLVIGGGIYGACVAWDATLRGLSVGLLERSDFASATSANSLKIIHGGFRYLQHADFGRMRESIAERRNLMRIAPHLIHPLPVLIPTYGHWTQRKGVIRAALAINDIMGLGINGIDDPQKHLPRGRVISRSEVIESVPHVEQRGLTHGLLFYDAQVYNSERLVISFLHSAATAGADLANYAEVTGFIRTGDSINGVNVRDVLSGERFEIQAKMVVNTAGPWVSKVLDYLDMPTVAARARLAKAVNIVTRPLTEGYAVGITAKSGCRNSGGKTSKGNRFLFVAPWRGRSLVGTTYSAYDEDPDGLQVTQDDMQSLIEALNQAWPSAGVTQSDVEFSHGGLLPSYGIQEVTGDVQLTNHYQIHDHRKEGINGLLSVIGVKYTTARRVAEKTVDKVFEIRRQKPPRSNSSKVPLYGGKTGDFEGFLSAAVASRPAGIGGEPTRHLVYNYGSEYHQVLDYVKTGFEKSNSENNRFTVLKAEVLHGVRDEMAQKLGDVVFRRTELGTAGYPGHEAINVCAEAMAAELGWGTDRLQQELQEVEQKYMLSRVLV